MKPLALVVAVGALGALCACGTPATQSGGAGSSPAAQPSAPQKTAPPLDLQSRRVGSKYIYVTEVKKNRKVYVLRADEQRAQYFGTGTGQSEFTNPHIVFYDEAGRTLKAVAPLGVVYEHDKTVVMSHGVHARTQDGKTLTCDTLRYNDATGKLHGSGNVVVTSPAGEELRGDQLDADVRLSRLVMTGAAGGQ
jgi:LPS export ABC transporter protein LptC